MSDETTIRITDADLGESQPNIVINREDLPPQQEVIVLTTADLQEEPPIVITRAELMRGEHEERCHTWAGRLPTKIRTDWGVVSAHIGIPTDGKANAQVLPPYLPHVFIADEFQVIDEDHPGGVELGKTKILIAHGEKTAAGWKFANGQDVIKTMRVYNRWADQNGVTPVEFIASCNKLRPGIRVPNIPHIEDIRVGELGGEDAYSTVTYTVDEYLIGGGTVLPDGNVKMYIKTEAKSLFNLDKLLTSRQIKIL